MIDVVEPRSERLTIATQLGARKAMPPQEITSRSEMYSIAFECSSRNEAFELLQGCTQREGRICILSDGNIEPLTLRPAFHEKELLLVGSSDGWDYQEHAKWFFNIAQKHTSDLEKLFDYHTSADDLIATFELMATGAIVPIKVLVKYNTDISQTFRNDQ